MNIYNQRPTSDHVREKLRTLRFRSRSAPSSRMIFKRLNANLVEMIFSREREVEV